MKTVLVVEDEDSAIALYEAMLSAHDDWQMVIARSGEAALLLAASEPADIILLDIQLPLMDGLAVCRQLKTDAATSAIPIVVVTAFAQAGTRASVEAAGADEFVSKPFNVAELTEIVERFIG
jgi:CheY-like chemotaxis protein